MAIQLLILDGNFNEWHSNYKMMLINTYIQRNVHCWDVWNTTEGGPCDLRFAVKNAWDAPNPHEEPDQFCLKRSWKAEGPCEITGKFSF